VTRRGALQGILWRCATAGTFDCGAGRGGLEPRASISATQPRDPGQYLEDQSVGAGAFSIVRRRSRPSLDVDASRIRGSEELRGRRYGQAMSLAPPTSVVHVDVLIESEHVCGVVLSFDADEPLMLLRECGIHERLHIVIDTWKIEVWFAA
jgi:hypothetical protein